MKEINEISSTLSTVPDQNKQSKSIDNTNRENKEFQKDIYFYFIDYVKAFDCLDYNKLWNILKEIRVPYHLTCLLRNLSVGQEATVRTEHETTDWFKIGKGIQQGCILSLCFLNFCTGYIM